MNIILFGLGNYGSEYEFTRHNAGKLVLLELAKLKEVEFKKDSTVTYGVYKNKEGDSVYFVFSNQFMNTSGKELYDWLSYNKLNFDYIWSLQDDSDQLTGNMKLVKKGGSAGHKGVDSLYNHIDKSKQIRLKIGIRPEGNTLKSETFVLKRFGSDELEKLKQVALLFQGVEWSKLGDKNYFSNLQTRFNSF
jgi:peptidyl-tRNA hydrolase, PTH1 family